LVSKKTLKRLALQIPATASIIVIHLGSKQYIDQSGLFTIEDILIDLVQQDKTILLVDVLEQPKY